MAIHVLKQKASSQQIREMLEEWEDMVKIAVDLNQRIAAGGGEYHSDCEDVLVEDEGCSSSAVWGANWYPHDQRLECTALLNIRPDRGNRSMLIEDAAIRTEVEEIARQLLEGVYP